MPETDLCPTATWTHCSGAFSEVVTARVCCDDYANMAECKEAFINQISAKWDAKPPNC